MLRCLQPRGILLLGLFFCFVLQTLLPDIFQNEDISCYTMILLHFLYEQKPNPVWNTTKHIHITDRRNGNQQCEAKQS